MPHGKGEMTWPGAGGKKMKGTWSHGEMKSGKVWKLVAKDAEAAVPAS
jgi:hypothetical protein